MEALILEETDNSLMLKETEKSNNKMKNTPNKLLINTIMPKFMYVNKNGQHVTVSKNIPL